MPTADALRLAQEADLDLVEVAPTAPPPVCKIMDYGKFKYENAQKAREARRNQTNVIIKEMKLRPKIDAHDYETKKGHVVRFLEAGSKVKVTIMFRGREQSRPELGFRLLQRLGADVADYGFVETSAKQDGRNMIMVLGPHKKKAEAKAEIKAAKGVADTWAAVNEAVGSRQGGKFAQIAQSVTLSILVERANEHLCDLKPRYQLMTGGDDLAPHIVDQDMGDEVRSTRSLSGGERFLVSLALALALSSMGGHGGLATTLFIDEGFGSLDAESLDIAMDALETLQAQGRTIGVISHVEAMKDRIPVQVRVTRRGAGSSTVALTAAA